MSKKRLPIMLQLGAMLGVAIILLMLVVGILVYNYQDTSKEFAQLINHTVARTLIVKTAQNDFTSSVLGTRSYIASVDSKYETASKQDLAKSYEVVKNFAATTKVEETRREAEKLEKLLNDYIALNEQIFSAKKANNPSLGTLVTQGGAAYEQIDQQFDKTIGAQDKTLSSKTQSLLDGVGQDIMLFSIISVLACIASLVIVGWYSRNTVKRIGNVRAEILAVSNFDLSTKDLQAARNDEIGDIAGALAVMKQSLRAVANHLRETANTLAASSQELTATVEEQVRATETVAETANGISAGSMQNSNNINDISSTIQQVSAEAEEMSASAAVVNKSTQAAVDDVNHGVSLIEKVVMQNQTIEKTMADITQVSSSLVKGSADIQEIVSVIRNIAGQTNLLALNAAIEAARAGEAGRGFAVVADEVRKLAEQSAVATNHIGEIIEKMTSDISFSVQTVDLANKEVAEGKLVIAATQKGYGDITDKLVRVKTGIEQIALAVDETAQGMQAIVTGVQNISAVAEETTANTETVAAAAEEQTASMNEISHNAVALSNMATELHTIVMKFKM